MAPHPPSLSCDKFERNGDLRWYGTSARSTCNGCGSAASTSAPLTQFTSRPSSIHLPTLLPRYPATSLFYYSLLDTTSPFLTESNPLRHAERDSTAGAHYCNIPLVSRTSNPALRPVPCPESPAHQTPNTSTSPLPVLFLAILENWLETIWPAQDNSEKSCPFCHGSDPCTGYHPGRG